VEFYCLISGRSDFYDSFLLFIIEVLYHTRKEEWVYVDTMSGKEGKKINRRGKVSAH
jgi:hypothetical protein